MEELGPSIDKFLFGDGPNVFFLKQLSTMEDEIGRPSELLDEE